MHVKTRATLRYIPLMLPCLRIPLNLFDSGKKFA